MNLKNLRWKLFFLFVYGFGALSTTQTIPLIKDRGFNQSQQGILLASIAVFTLGLQILFGILSDQKGKMKPFFVMVFSSALFSTGALYFFEIRSFWVVFILVGLIGGAGRTFQSMIDTWVLQIKQEKEDFEKDKALGSVGWALGSWIAAIVASMTSFSFLGVFCLIAAATSLWLCYKTADVQRQSSLKWSFVIELLKNKEYLVMIALMTVLFSMGCADIYLVVDKMLYLGGTKFHVGLKWGLQSLAEAFVFLICDRLFQRFTLLPLLVFSTIMFGVRFLAYGLIQSYWLLILISLLQCVSFPIAIYCTKIAIDQCTDESVKSTGQLLGSSLYMGISLFFMPVLTSWLSNAFSHDFALYVVSLFSLIALCLIWVYKKIIS